MDQVNEQHEKFINYLVSVRDADSKESRLTQEKILEDIAHILKFIDISSAQVVSGIKKQRGKVEQRTKKREKGMMGEKGIQEAF